MRLVESIRLAIAGWLLRPAGGESCPPGSGRAAFRELLLDIHRGGAASHIAAWYEGDPIDLTPEQWAVVMDERQRLGRPLEREELERIVRAKGGDDGHR